MKKTDKQIMIPKEVRAEIMRAFRCTSAAVTYALTYQRDSQLAKMIRKMALEHGGRVYDGTRDTTDAGKVIILKQGERL